MPFPAQEELPSRTVEVDMVDTERVRRTNFLHFFNLSVEICFATKQNIGSVQDEMKPDISNAGLYATPTLDDCMVRRVPCSKLA